MNYYDQFYVEKKAIPNSEMMFIPIMQALIKV